MCYFAVISILMCLHVSYSSAASILTPDQFDQTLGGYDFCSSATPAQLKSICIAMANELGYSDYDESEFTSQACQYFTIWLKNSESNSAWKSRNPPLLYCLVSRPHQNDVPVYLGKGFDLKDVFSYGENNQGKIVAEGNYKNVLSTIIAF